MPDSVKKELPIGVTRDDKAAGAAREDGFIAGLKNAGITLLEENKRTSAFTLESGYEAALDLLESKCDIDVISCATDTIAAGAIEAIQTYLKAGSGKCSRCRCKNALYP